MSPTTTAAATKTKAKGSDSRKRRETKPDSSEKIVEKKCKIVNEAAVESSVSAEMEPNESSGLTKSKINTTDTPKINDNAPETKSKVLKRITRSQSNKGEAGKSSNRGSTPKEAIENRSQKRSKHETPDIPKKRKYVRKINIAVTKENKKDEVVKKCPGQSKISKVQAKPVAESDSKKRLNIQRSYKSRNKDTDSVTEQSERKKKKRTIEDERTKRNKKKMGTGLKESNLTKSTESRVQEMTIKKNKTVGNRIDEQKKSTRGLKTGAKPQRSSTKENSKDAKSRQTKHIPTKSTPGEQDPNFSESSEALPTELPVFSRTNKNLRKASNKPKDDDELPTCYCVYGDVCDIGCLNRSSQIECNPSHCPCKENCTNQRFQKAQYADVSPSHCKDSRGWGLFANHAIDEGEFVIEYTGEVINDEKFKRRIKRHHEHFYFMKIATNEIIDAREYGNDSRFANHSCDPNCRLEKWVVGGYIRAGLFAARKINKGEEITYDYKFDPTGNQTRSVFAKQRIARDFFFAKHQRARLKKKRRKEINHQNCQQRQKKLTMTHKIVNSNHIQAPYIRGLKNLQS